ncbi:MAG TPA: hypothetical protein VF982_12420, partial [Anaerolineales bacterium]
SSAALERQPACPARGKAPEGWRTPRRCERGDWRNAADTATSSSAKASAILDSLSTRRKLYKTLIYKTQASFDAQLVEAGGANSFL